MVSPSRGKPEYRDPKFEFRNLECAGPFLAQKIFLTPVSFLKK